MCDKWYENLDNGKLIGVVFLDIRKAFDSVDHNILLNKMKTQFAIGFTNIELDWFQSYLTNREQVCRINGKFSSPKKIITGVPQGSILGPLLFLLYINDLPVSVFVKLLPVCMLMIPRYLPLHLITQNLLIT